MTITIQLTPELEAIVHQEATRRGEQPAEFVRGLVARTLSQPTTLADLLLPFRQQVRDSGISEGELEELIEEARQERFDERSTAVQ